VEFRIAACQIAPMPTARVGRIDIEYEDLGPRDGRPLLLIMGLGAQMILWEDALCAAFAERGHRVIRFDNRDVGRSTRLTEAGMPDMQRAAGAYFAGQPVEAPYTLSDMAADAAGLLDALRIPSAHVVGASLGGMIAQTLAIEHPQRVRSLTSIMSSTGRAGLPPATPEAMAVLLTPTPADCDAYVERSVQVFRTIGSPGFPFDADGVRRLARLSWERGISPDGPARQLLAVIASGSRHERLAAVKVPTLVFHGAADPLMPVEHARDTAACVPHAELVLVDGMGHDLPHPVWPRLVDAITRLTSRS
jgi:pimeloyl-ACP methyl ester carboxylesterase